MTHVVTERCVDCRYVDCARVCPVDCFYEVKDPAMLVISPDECIDCKACVPECPVHAIWPEDELPSVYTEWTAKNAELWSLGVQVPSDTDIQQRGHRAEVGGDGHDLAAARHVQSSPRSRGGQY